MFISFVVFLVLLALLVLVAGVLAAVFLVMGTFLSRLFAVSVWEATVVALGVAAVILWYFWRTPMVETEEPLEEVESEPHVWVMPDFPLPPRRGSKKRKR